MEPTESPKVISQAEEAKEEDGEGAGQAGAVQGVTDNTDERASLRRNGR